MTSPPNQASTLDQRTIDIFGAFQLLQAQCSLLIDVGPSDHHMPDDADFSPALFRQKAVGGRKGIGNFPRLPPGSVSKRLSLVLLDESCLRLPVDVSHSRAKQRRRKPRPPGNHDPSDRMLQLYRTSPEEGRHRRPLSPDEACSIGTGMSLFSLSHRPPISIR